MPREFDYSFGGRIKNRRLILGFTQQYCAYECKVSERSWIKWEVGKATPLRVHRDKVLDFLGI